MGIGQHGIIPDGGRALGSFFFQRDLGTVTTQKSYQAIGVFVQKEKGS